MCDHQHLSMERPYPSYFIILILIVTVDKRGGTIRDTYFYWPNSCLYVSYPLFLVYHSLYCCHHFSSFHMACGNMRDIFQDNSTTSSSFSNIEQTIRSVGSWYHYNKWIWFYIVTFRYMSNIFLIWIPEISSVRV